MRGTFAILAMAWLLALQPAQAQNAEAKGQRVHARDLGIAPGIFAPGANNAITDVAGVRVGQVTLREGDTHTRRALLEGFFRPLVALRDETPGIALHLVGQLQSNKAEEAVTLFDDL